MREKEKIQIFQEEKKLEAWLDQKTLTHF